MAKIAVVLDPDGAFYVYGELDLTTVETFAARMSGSVEGDREVVLDLTDVSSIDPAGIRQFLLLAQQGCGRCLVLRNPRLNVAHALESSGILDHASVRIESSRPF